MLGQTGKEVKAADELTRIQQLVTRASCEIFGHAIVFDVQHDKRDPEHGRIYLQPQYSAKDTKTALVETFRGRKWYLSMYMTDDEVLKTCFAAFRLAIEHEVLEGFRIDGQAVFNPHTPVDVLLTVSTVEAYRAPES